MFISWMRQSRLPISPNCWRTCPRSAQVFHNIKSQISYCLWQMWQTTKDLRCRCATVVSCSYLNSLSWQQQTNLSVKLASSTILTKWLCIIVTKYIIRIIHYFSVQRCLTNCLWLQWKLSCLGIVFCWVMNWGFVQEFVKDTQSSLNTAQSFQRLLPQLNENYNSCL